MFIGTAVLPESKYTFPPPLDGFTVVLIHTKFVQLLPAVTSIAEAYVCVEEVPFGPIDPVQALSAIGVVHD